MGIYKLMELIRLNAAESIKQRDLGYYSGMSIALDASMAMYQFIISTQGYDHNALTALTDSEGNKTAHLLGMMNRTIALLQNGIKPVWVFDGKPPTKKNGELLRRRRIKDEAADKADDAKQLGNLQEAVKQQKSTISVGKKQKEDCIRMLQLLGVPIIQAPCEAEAQCSYMCKAGKVDCVGTEDMDALTFGAKLMIREINQKKESVTEINHEVMLKCLGLTMDQFIDMCILSGCDYVPRVSGIGPIKAYKLIQDHKTMEKIVEYLYGENDGCEQGRFKYGMPKLEDFCYQDARELFKHPLVDKEVEFKFDKNALDEVGLRAFLIGEKNFSEKTLEGCMKRLKNSISKGRQPRLEAFFGKPIITKHSDVGPKQKQLPKKNKSKSSTKTVKKSN